MEYSVESMTTNTMDGHAMFRLDRAWDNRMGGTIQQSTNHSTNTRSSIQNEPTRRMRQPQCPIRCQA